MAAEPGAISAGFSGLAKLATGIPGLDHVTDGGLPLCRTTLVSGTAGSAKTILSAQFLAAGIQQRGEHGVFVTLEESPADIRANCIGFGWNIEQWEREGKWAFVDGSLRPDEEVVFAGAYDFGALAARVEAAVVKVGAVRLSMDSLGAVFSQFDNDAVVRRELFRLSSALKRMNVTSMLTVERCNHASQGRVSVHGDPRRRHRSHPAIGRRVGPTFFHRQNHVRQLRSRPHVRWGILS
jgi:circadian clock protein KaiC